MKKFSEWKENWEARYNDLEKRIDDKQWIEKSGTLKGVYSILSDMLKYQLNPNSQDLKAEINKARADISRLVENLGKYFTK